jgi:hypothetical protein
MFLILIPTLTGSTFLLGRGIVSPPISHLNNSMQGKEIQSKFNIMQRKIKFYLQKLMLVV